MGEDYLRRTFILSWHLTDPFSIFLLYASITVFAMASHTQSALFSYFFPLCFVFIDVHAVSLEQCVDGWASGQNLRVSSSCEGLLLSKGSSILPLRTDPKVLRSHLQYLQQCTVRDTTHLELTECLSLLLLHHSVSTVFLMPREDH